MAAGRLVEREQHQDALREQRSIVARLINENNAFQEQTTARRATQSDEQSMTLPASGGTRVDKQLVKNVLLSYFQTPADKQLEVMPLLAALVDFTHDEYQKAIEALENNQNNGTSSWLPAWLGSNPVRARTDTQFTNKVSRRLLLFVDTCAVRST
jgi:uncharacterized protein YoaH (UPF0181 family)